MTYIITSLCVREGSCVTACPVECIVPGKPQDAWPLYYIDPDTCIDCGACVSQCPFHAIFNEDDVPEAFIAVGGEVLNAPANTPGFNESFVSHDYEGNEVHLESTRTLVPDEEIDLTPDIQKNYDFFRDGPGYGAMM